MDNEFTRKLAVSVFLVSLLILSFLILRPILLSIMVGVILAIVFSPLQNWLDKYIKIRGISSGLICLFFLMIIILPIWFFTPIFLNQAFQVYQFSQQIDFVGLLKGIFPSLFSSQEFSQEVGSIIHSFTTKATNYLVNSISSVITNFPEISLHLLVIFFTLFFVLRDKEQIIDYIKSLLPFSKEIEEKLFKFPREITLSVIYGQVLIGIIQGLIAGLGFFLFGVNNALLLTILSMIMGIVPILGTVIIWGPVVLYLFIAGNTISAIGVTAFGVISSFIDNILRPIFISRMTKMHPLIFLLGMVGGLFFFGIIGFILGPLILAYLLILLEAYRGKNLGGLFIQSQEKRE